MSLVLKKPEEICVCEKEQNLNVILINIEERQKCLSDLELFFDSLVEVMKNYVFFGAEKVCYQWIYAKKTKEIVDKIKDFNTFLRTFQKNSALLEKTKKFIDDILQLEKTNFENVLNIFNKKMNFLKSFENSTANRTLISRSANKENFNGFAEGNEKPKIQRNIEIQTKIEVFEKELSEIISNHIETRQKLHLKILEIKPTNF